MKKTLFTITLLILVGLLHTKAQTLIYNENFDADTLLPSGWSSTTGGWVVKSTNPSTGYTGASGVNNVTIDNSVSATGSYNLISKSVSTVNYNNIIVDWAARFTTHFSDSGSVIQGFYWSANNGNTWNQVTYTENGNNSTWSIDNGSVPISLPSGAANQASVIFKWTANIHHSSSGTYRIDDFTVAGTALNGIEQIAIDNDIKVYSYNKSIYVHFENENTGQLKIFSLLGQEVMTKNLHQTSEKIDVSELPAGVYTINVSNAQNKNVIKKIVIN